ncbi:hypothetical protein HDV05_005409 [Chytridiales sp. JEL 0842]|nr:hypothetical protein HDV05_005409 [Chytridiales sp. JEL 0842]
MDESSDYSSRKRARGGGDMDSGDRRDKRYQSGSYEPAEGKGAQLPPVRYKPQIITTPTWHQSYAKMVREALAEVTDAKPQNPPAQPTPTPADTPSHPSVIFKPPLRVVNPSTPSLPGAPPVSSESTTQSPKIATVSLTCRTCRNPIGKALIHGWTKTAGEMMLWAEMQCTPCANQEEAENAFVGGDQDASEGDEGSNWVGELGLGWSDVRIWTEAERSLVSLFAQCVREDRGIKADDNVELKVLRHRVCFGGGMKPNKTGGDVECTLCKRYNGFGCVTISEVLPNGGKGGESQPSPVGPVPTSKHGADEEVSVDGQTLDACNTAAGSADAVVEPDSKGWYGRWREMGLEMLFSTGRKTCSLSHVRLGDPENHSIVVSSLDEDEMVAEFESILRRCQLLFYECLNSLAAVPEVIESLTENGSFETLQRYLELRFQSSYAFLIDYRLSRDLPINPPTSCPFLSNTYPPLPSPSHPSADTTEASHTVVLDPSSNTMKLRGYMRPQIYLARVTFNEARSRKARKSLGSISANNSKDSVEEEQVGGGGLGVSSVRASSPAGSGKVGGVSAPGSGMADDYGEHSGGYAIALYHPITGNLTVLDLVLRVPGMRQGGVEGEVIFALAERVSQDVSRGVFDYAIGDAISAPVGSSGGEEVAAAPVGIAKDADGVMMEKHRLHRAGLGAVQMVMERAFARWRMQIGKVGFIEDEVPTGFKSSAATLSSSLSATCGSAHDKDATNTDTTTPPSNDGSARVEVSNRSSQVNVVERMIGRDVGEPSASSIRTPMVIDDDIITTTQIGIPLSKEIAQPTTPAPRASTAPLSPQGATASSMQQHINHHPSPSDVPTPSSSNTTSMQNSMPNPFSVERLPYQRRSSLPHFTTPAALPPQPYRPPSLPPHFNSSNPNLPSSPTSSGPYQFSTNNYGGPILPAVPRHKVEDLDTHYLLQTRLDPLLMHTSANELLVTFTKKHSRKKHQK